MLGSGAPKHQASFIYAIQELDDSICTVILHPDLIRRSYLGINQNVDEYNQGIIIQHLQLHENIASDIMVDNSAQEPTKRKTS